MLIIAHRGASAYAPEHTFAAWDLAREIGVDFLEQDLQLTRDGVLVVLHDETLDRTVVGARGRVIDHTAAELAALDAGSWFNAARPEHASAAFAREGIPRLDAVLTRYADACFYIETKKPEEAPGMEAELLRLLREHELLDAAAADWRVLIQSFSEASLRWIHAREPALPLIRLVDRGWRDSADDAALREIATYAVGIGPAALDVDTAWVEAAHATGLHVHPWTVNDVAEMERLTAAGVDGMFTDRPDVLRALRPADEPRGAAAAAAAAARHRSRRGQQRPAESQAADA